MICHFDAHKKNLLQQKRLKSNCLNIFQLHTKSVTIHVNPDDGLKLSLPCSVKLLLTSTYKYWRLRIIITFANCELHSWAAAWCPGSTLSHKLSWKLIKKKCTWQKAPAKQCKRASNVISIFKRNITKILWHELNFRGRRANTLTKKMQKNRYDN